MKNIVVKSFITALFLTAALVFVPDRLSANSAPEFDPIVVQTVMEGNIFNYTVSASDIDDDQISILAVSKPVGSTFIDNGDGTAVIQWQPEFTGPNSADGSPFTMSFMASDGMASDQIQADIIVQNNNRKPVINSVENIEVVAGDLVLLTLTGYDPDYDLLTWSLLSAPSQMSFSSDVNASLSWQTLFADSGSYLIEVELADTYGITDTANISLNVLPKAIYTLKIDSVSAYPGETVSMNVNLMNLEDVSGFNILINYDVSALFLSSLTPVGTRSESFEYFTYNLENNNINGDVLITGIADLDNGITTDNLSAGDGSIVKLAFYVTNNLMFSNYAVPITFVFRNAIDNKDNTLTDDLGETIASEAIGFENGLVAIKEVDISSVGDINLNGVTYEIGDAIYFINYFINPGKYPLDPKQKANTDVNQDGLTATVADLVYLVNYLVNPYIVNKIRANYDPVEFDLYTSADNFSISSKSDAEIGGLAITLEGEKPINILTANNLNIGVEGMTVKSSVDGNLLRLLIYGEDGAFIPAGINDMILINSDNKLTVKELDVSSADGKVLKTIVSESSHSVVPDGFTLEQNFPNPFNPSTEIDFSLPKMSRINLTVYNVLGQEVITLIESSLPSGNHKVTWDGRDNMGSAVSSGIYFYRLVADNFEAKRKMILLK